MVKISIVDGSTAQSNAPAKGPLDRARGLGKRADASSIIQLAIMFMCCGSARTQQRLWSGEPRTVSGFTISNG